MRNVIIAICAVVLLGISTLTICGCSKAVVDAPTDLEALTDETEIVAETPTNTETPVEAGVFVEEEATVEEEEVIAEYEEPAELILLFTKDVTPAEMNLIIDGEKFREKIFRTEPSYELRSNGSYVNTLAVMIDENEYALMEDDFGYHSVAELKEALLEYFTAEFINTTPFFNQNVADKYSVPVYYRDFNDELYKWNEGDYFYEAASYVWNSEAYFKTISRTGNSAVIEFSMYIKPMYSGNQWCTRQFAIEANRINTIEHIGDYEPTVSDFEGKWVSYDEDGNFVLAYSLSYDHEVEYGWGNGGPIMVYYADGTILNHDKYSYDYGFISFGESVGGRIETYSHDGFNRFTTSETKYDDNYNVISKTITTYVRVEDISVVDGKVVIK